MATLSDPVRIYLERRRQLEQDRWEREKWRAEQERYNRQYELSKKSFEEQVRQWEENQKWRQREFEAEREKERQAAQERIFSWLTQGLAKPGVVSSELPAPPTEIAAPTKSAPAAPGEPPAIPLAPSSIPSTISPALKKAFPSKIPGGIEIGGQYLIPTSPTERAEAAAELEMKIEDKKNQLRYEQTMKRINENSDLLPESVRNTVKASLLLGTPININWETLRTWAQEKVHDRNVSEEEKKRLRELLADMMKWEIGVRSAASAGNPLNVFTIQSYQRAAELLNSAHQIFTQQFNRAPTREELTEILTQFAATDTSGAAAKALELLQQKIVTPPKDTKTPADTIRELLQLKDQLSSGNIGKPGPLPPSMIPTTPSGGPPPPPSPGPTNLDLEMWLKKK